MRGKEGLGRKPIAGQISQRSGTAAAVKRAGGNNMSNQLGNVSVATKGEVSETSVAVCRDVRVPRCLGTGSSQEEDM